MEGSSFFNEIEKQLQQNLPFVVYRLPNHHEIKSWLQNSDDLQRSKDLKEEGFVFAPYEHSEDPVIFEKSKCRILSATEKFKPEERKIKSFQEVYAGVHDYKNTVQKAIEYIKHSSLSKVVLSRVINVGHEVHKPLDLLKTLLAQYPNAFVYCWVHPKVGVWLGATPELLLEHSRNQLKTVSLAGTLSADDPVNWSQKERHEQQVVTDYIAEQLQCFSKKVSIEGPEEVRAGRLRHLKTKLTASLDLKHSELSEIVKALHPTPAVCGFPKELAQEFIRSHEPYNRSFYTGYLGEINSKIELFRTRDARNTENRAFRSVSRRSHLFVNLRCMELVNSSARIYVGGGIVESSDPEREWAETLEKSQTMLSIL